MAKKTETEKTFEILTKMLMTYSESMSGMRELLVSIDRRLENVSNFPYLQGQIEKIQERLKEIPDEKEIEEMFLSFLNSMIKEIKSVQDITLKEKEFDVEIKKELIKKDAVIEKSKIESSAIIKAKIISKILLGLSALASILYALLKESITK